MISWRFAQTGLAAVLVWGVPQLHAQGFNQAQVDLANLREDVRLLSQRVGELNMTIEQLQRDNAELKARLGSTPDYVTLAQLNRSVAELNQTMTAALAAQQTEILQQVGAQIEKLARQTQAALDAVAKGGAPAAVPGKPMVFADDYPKEGIKYTVQRGDTLAEIARKNNASLRDIVNANKIADATKIQVGQVLFIPQGK